MDFSLITDEPLNYCVYAHVNKTNGKMYIGITNNPQSRWANKGNNYKNCTHFYNAIQKYGWDGFNHVIIFQNISLFIANIIEEELIKKYNTIDNGYNIKSGGAGGGRFGKNHHKSRPIYQYDLNGNFLKRWGCPIDAENYYHVKDITRSANYGCIRAGFRWSYDYVESMPVYDSVKNHQYLPAYQYNKDGTFIKKWDNRKDAISEYGVGIYNCIYNVAKTAYGYRWSCEYKDKLPPLQPTQYTRKKKEISSKNSNSKYEHSQRVYRFGLDGNLMQIYNNCASIKDSDIKIKTVYELCLKSICFVYHNSVWVYESDAYTGYVQQVIERHFKIHPQIDQYSMDGKYLNTYNSMAELEKLGYNHSNIHNACKGIRKSAYGYMWKFKYNKEVKYG